MCLCESRTIWWDDGLWLIDQTKLPVKLEPIRMESVRQLVEARSESTRLNSSH